MRVSEKETKRWSCEPVKTEQHFSLMIEVGILAIPSSVNTEIRRFTWRHPLTFAGRLTNQLLVAGSQTVVDIWSIETGKIVHVVETKRDRTRSLNLLSCRDSKLHMTIDEEYEGVKKTSIIQIAHEVIDRV